MSNLSGRLFRGVKGAKGELEALLKSAGVPFKSLGWDSYDNSVEIHGVPAPYRLSEDAQGAVYRSGFSTAYVNHADKWETHYRFGPGDFVVSKGWRVSYPHKRGDDGVIWVEEVVDTWPKEWFATGYCIVKDSANASSE